MPDIFDLMKNAPSLDEDEYSGEGKTISDLHGLEENDEWVKPPSFQKAFQDAMTDVLQKEMDRMRQEGIIPPEVPAEESPIKESQAFVDPEDDEDLTIYSDIMSVFWRIVMPGQRLIDIVALEPSVTKLGIMGRNNAAGCWIAFTSKKIAKRIADSLMAKGIVLDNHLCNKEGKQLGSGVITPVNKAEVEDWRPWKQTGNQTEEPYKSEEFLYCISVDPGVVRVFFVPESYWNENHRVYDGEINIEHLIKGYLTKTNKNYCYTSTRSELSVQADLFRDGFRESLLFNAYVNEELL